MTDTRVSSGSAVLRHCPFCTSERVQVCLGIGAVYHVECPSCLASGPHAKNEATAADAWNTRTPAITGQGEAVAWQAHDLKGGIWRHCDYPHSNPDFEYRPLFASSPTHTDRVREALEADVERWKQDKGNTLSEYAAEQLLSRLLAALSPQAQAGGDAQRQPNRMDKGRAFYLAMYEKDGAVWAANDHKGLWCDMAEDYERRLSALPSTQCPSDGEIYAMVSQIGMTDEEIKSINEAIDTALPSEGK